MKRTQCADCRPKSTLGAERAVWNRVRVTFSAAVVRPATLDDVVSLHGIRRACELWLAAQGIEQWGVGEVSIGDVSVQVEEGEWFVGVNDSDQVISGLRYLVADRDVWPDAKGDGARYVHGLMVDRELARAGTGAFLLSWAESRAVAEGAHVMRLDCVESNERLREFYRDRGYREVGRRDFHSVWLSATLFEKSLPVRGASR